MKTMNVQKTRNWKRQPPLREHAGTAIRIVRMVRQENHIAAPSQGYSGSLLDHNAN